eukprot:4964212-Prymnesium_polylepis.1
MRRRMLPSSGRRTGDTAARRTAGLITVQFSPFQRHAKEPRGALFSALRPVSRHYAREPTS